MSDVLRKSRQAKTSLSASVLIGMRWRWVELSNWAHIIETVRLSFRGCGSSLAVLIRSWDQSTSDLGNVCVNPCEELWIFINKSCWFFLFFYEGVYLLFLVIVSVCVQISILCQGQRQTSFRNLWNNSLVLFRKRSLTIRKCVTYATLLLDFLNFYFLVKAYKSCSTIVHSCPLTRWIISSAHSPLDLSDAPVLSHMHGHAARALP